ncbi:hypothetical protein Vadar_018913 [Vaccinium darrowii]|uniref:Uncharacterized protein n=1 Tax=Vaccinium darrowii TaxID=229202 RepID=A0ACB7Z5L7_9ERIC|nr:hypothetical protein Vadar_018913 [Vaccinium darrowii]
MVVGARDDDGHGTHVASTAAGTGVANANTFGFANGIARGIASKAGIAMYNACWQDFFCSDVFAGMEAAIKDGRSGYIVKAFADAPNACTGHPGAPGDLNYPSFSVVFKGNCTIQELKRAVTNVGELLSEIYKVRVVNFEAEKLTVTVKPRSLIFEKLDEEQSYLVNFESNYSGHKNVDF